jgi:RNA polymerase sigma-70 factor (ECF subfamily)
MNSYTDIIQGVRRSETQAQMAFYDMFAHATYQSAVAVVGNSDDAEEVVQDNILKVLTKTSLLHDDVAAMKRILCRMAVNQAIDTLRKRKDFVVAVETYEHVDCADDQPEADEPGVDDIRDGIDRLPDIYRTIIALRLFEEMSFDDIASQLRINPSTVRVQYTRGIAKLRTYLKQKQNRNERIA